MANAIRELAVRLRGHPGPAELRDALAEAFDDPPLEVVLPARGRRLGRTRPARPAMLPADR